MICSEREEKGGLFKLLVDLDRVCEGRGGKNGGRRRGRAPPPPRAAPA